MSFESLNTATMNLPATNLALEKSLKVCKALYSSKTIRVFRKALVCFSCSEIAKGSPYMWYGVSPKGTKSPLFWLPRTVPIQTDWKKTSRRESNDHAQKS